jgi:hypothetical protein
MMYQCKFYACIYTCQNCYSPWLNIANIVIIRWKFSQHWSGSILEDIKWKDMQWHIYCLVGFTNSQAVDSLRAIPRHPNNVGCGMMLEISENFVPVFRPWNAHALTCKENHMTVWVNWTATIAIASWPRHWPMLPLLPCPDKCTDQCHDS